MPAFSTALSDRLPANCVLPDYRGGSILNLPATVGSLLGTEGHWGSPPLHARFGEVFAGDWQRVILLLVDGVGWNRLERQLATDDAGFLTLERRRGLARARLTSVSPSTTSVATTSLLGNGAAPAEHGMLGYSFWLPAADTVANALFWKPAYDPRAVDGALQNLGVTPDGFLPMPGLFAALAAAGVPGTALYPRALAHSPLSRMQLPGVEVEGYDGLPALTEQVLAWQQRAPPRSFAYGYLPDFDALSHRDGPDGASWSELWRSFVPHLTALVEKLAPDTLLLLTADHGHVHTPPAERRTFQQYRELETLCRCPPGGEARHVYLYAKAGAVGELLAYARSRMEDAFTVLAGAEALTGGLYGPPARRHPEASERVGDVVLLARGGASMWDADNDALLLGMHGALEADEMLVPLIGFATR